MRAQVIIRGLGRGLYSVFYILILMLLALFIFGISRARIAHCIMLGSGHLRCTLHPTDHVLSQVATLPTSTKFASQLR